MKTLKNIIYTLILMGVIGFVYKNIDIITEYTQKIFLSNRKVILTEANEYKRNYDYITFSYEEDYVPYNKKDIENILFNVLNNGWDTFTFYCPIEYKECEKDAQEISNDKVLVTMISNYVSPYNTFSHITTTIEYKQVTWQIEKKYKEEEINALKQKIDSIINELNLNNLTDHDKIKVLHNYIIKNTMYDNNMATTNESVYQSNKAYGSLIEGYAVCSGYSDAISLFLDEFNIPNIKVSSDNHVWNLVYIDGSWKHLDLTWDDTENIYTFYNYFLINTEELKNLDATEHNYDISFYLELINQ